MYKHTLCFLFCSVPAKPLGSSISVPKSVQMCQHPRKCEVDTHVSVAVPWLVESKAVGREGFVNSC